MSNQRMMGFDFGQKHIGIAVGQTITRTASPLSVIPSQRGIPYWKALDVLIAQWQPQVLVVGLPLNMDGTMSPMAHKAKVFAAQLEARYHQPTHCVDERLSTKEAERWFIQQYQRLPKKAEIDTLSAVIILESFMSSGPE